jgi:hypothetical protein
MRPESGGGLLLHRHSSARSRRTVAYSYSSAHSGDLEAVEQLDDSVIALIIRTNGAFVVGIKE